MSEPHRWDPRCPAPRDLVRPVAVDPSGLAGPTRGQAEGRRWRRTSRGLLVPSSVDPTRPEQRILEQSMRLPAEGAVSGWAGCRLRGGTFFDGLTPDRRSVLPVPLVVGPRARIRRNPQVVVSYDRLDPVDRSIRHGIPCASALRAVFDAMRWAPEVREATVALDMSAAAEITSIRRVADYCATRAGWNGVPLVRAALGLASEASRSPNETRMRLLWVLDAGFPPPSVNTPVYDLAGRVLGIADLLDVDAGLVGEFDGAEHRHARRHTEDVRREDGLRRHGLEVFRVTGRDLASPSLVVARMRAARHRAAWEPLGERRWTVVDRWADTRGRCLDEVLDHRDLLAAVDHAPL